MKKLVVILLMGLTLISCSAGVGVGVGRHGVSGRAGVWF